MGNLQFFMPSGMEEECVYQLNWMLFVLLLTVYREGHLPIVKCLMEKGANSNLKDKRSRTPFHLAVRYITYNIMYNEP